MKVVIELNIGSEVDEDTILEGGSYIHYVIMDALSEFATHREEPYYEKYKKIFPQSERVAVARALHGVPSVHIYK